MLHNEFDRNFDKRREDILKRHDEFERNFDKAKTAFGIWWVFCAALSIVTTGVLGYVAYHFIAKVW